MKKTIKIECHDCGEELSILDQYDEINPSKFEYCVYCGSDNIEVNDE